MLNAKISNACMLIHGSYDRPAGAYLHNDSLYCIEMHNICIVTIINHARVCTGWCRSILDCQIRDALNADEKVVVEVRMLSGYDFHM